MLIDRDIRDDQELFPVPCSRLSGTSGGETSNPQNLWEEIYNDSENRIVIFKFSILIPYPSSKVANCLNPVK